MRFRPAAIAAALGALALSCSHACPTARPANGAPRSRTGTVVSVLDFGAKGDGRTDDTGAIQSALGALPKSGGVIYFPAGTYLFGSPLAISSTTNIRFVGDGARIMQDFDESPSRLVYVGAGDAPAIHLSTNYARGWSVENLEIAYSNPAFTGSLIFVERTAGISFERCALGGASAGPPYLTSARAVIQIASTERVLLRECTVQFAKRGVWVPSCAAGTCPHADDSSASNGANNTSLLTVEDSAFNNFTRADVEIEDGGSLGDIIRNNLFDSTSVTNPEFGIVLHGDGFSVSGNTFTAGDMRKTPRLVQVDLYGYGDFSANTVHGFSPGVRLNPGGVFHVAGNFVLGRPPMTIGGGLVDGAGNTWEATDGAECGVDIESRGNATNLSLGPDYFPSKTENSYRVRAVAPLYTTAGIIRYDPSFDSSRSGPTTNSPFVTLENARLGELHLATPAAADNKDRILGETLLPGGALDRDGAGIRFHVWGAYPRPADAVRLQVKLGSAVLLDTGNRRPRGSAWEIRGTLVRASAGRVRGVVSGNWGEAAIGPQVVDAELGLADDLALAVHDASADRGAVTLAGLEVSPLR